MRNNNPNSLPRFRSYTIRSNTVPFTIAPSSSPYSTRTVGKAAINLVTVSCTNCTAGPRRYSISWRRKNTASNPKKSLSSSTHSPIQTNNSPREEIGVLTSLPLLRKVVEDLEEARNHGRSSLTCYFTKESHIHTLVNLVLLSGLPIANRRIPELDYAVRTDFSVINEIYQYSDRDSRI